MAHGRFVVFEGGEGAGKTTLMQNVAAELKEQGAAVVTTREPGGTPFAEEVREALLKKREDHNEYPTPLAQLLAFYAARFDHIEKIILPALESDKTVLCDRFELTSYAYQVHALDQSLLETFLALHGKVCDLLGAYELTYILCDIDPEAGVRRALAREDANTSFDEKRMDFHYKADEGRKAAQTYIQDCFGFHTIDASKTPDEMAAATLEIINQK